MLECPFCPYRTTHARSSYQILVHIETEHPDSDDSTTDESLSLALSLAREDEAQLLNRGKPDHPSSRTLSRQEQSSGKDDSEYGYVKCPRSGCGEHVSLIDYNDHLDIHALLDNKSLSHTIATTARADSGHEPNIRRSLEPKMQANHKIAKMVENQKPESTLSRTAASPCQEYPIISDDKAKQEPIKKSRAVRLGKRELGPFAYEEKMPKWLYDELKRGPQIKHVNRLTRDGRLVRESFIEHEVSGILPVLAQISDISKTVERAYFCHPSVQHVSKRRDHAGFCGYLNIQMQISYIQGTKAPGYQNFGKRIPGILEIQDIIEDAWKNDINPLGKLQTGGVKGTRKWIGTPEASAVYKNLGIPQQSNLFYHKDGKRAHRHVYDFVEAYFSQDMVGTAKIQLTNRAPIYLQHPGHSMTIVGLERHKDGSRNLLVFDPGFSTHKDILGFIGKQNLRKRISSRDTETLMITYRRSGSILGKYNCFETLSLTALPHPTPT